MKKTDRQIQQDVMEELTFDPSVSSENIGVAVNEGVVTLSGSVPSFGEKYAAEKATFRVAGVKAVAEEIEVKLPGSKIRTDLDIAKAAVNALEWRTTVPATVQVAVENGRVILRGHVKWDYQREACTEAVRYLNGVKSVVNHISILSPASTDDIKDRIEKALVRSAEEEARRVKVETVNGKVILTGTVNSRSEFEDAKWAAWAAPGVSTVENRLEIR